MRNEDDFQYAIENTRVVVPPDRHIDTFGTTSFRFTLVTELMDYVDRVRVRAGRIEAERPHLIAPQNLHKLILDGFGEDARGYADWIESHGADLKILRYGFQLKKTDLSEHLVHENCEAVVDRLKEEIRQRDDGISVLMVGVDDGWEVALLKFTMDLIQKSAGENLNEWKRRGLL